MTRGKHGAFAAFALLAAACATPSPATTANPPATVTPPPPPPVDASVAVVAAPEDAAAPPDANAAAASDAAPPITIPPSSLLGVVLSHAREKEPYAIEAYVLKLSFFRCSCPQGAICGTCGPSYVVVGEEPGLDPYTPSPRILRIDGSPDQPGASTLAVGSKYTFTVRTENTSWPDAGLPWVGASLERVGR